MTREIDGVRRKIKSICDYILGPRNDPVATHRVRHTTFIETDHRMVYVDLRLSAKDHQKYMRSRKKFPSLRGPKSSIDIEYAELVALQDNQQLQQRKARPSWISDATWALIRARQTTSTGTADGTNRKRQLLFRGL